MVGKTFISIKKEKEFKNAKGPGDRSTGPSCFTDIESVSRHFPA